MNPIRKTLTIGEVARLAGTTTRTIRYYHHEGLLPAPERDSAGRRVYRLAQVTRLLWIRRLTGVGLTLGEVRDALADGHDMGEILAGADAALAAQQQRIAEQRELIRVLRADPSGLGLVTADGSPELRALLEHHRVTVDDETLRQYLILERLLGVDEVARIALGDAVVASEETMAAQAKGISSGCGRNWPMPIPKTPGWRNGPVRVCDSPRPPREANAPRVSRSTLPTRSRTRPATPSSSPWLPSNPATTPRPRNGAPWPSTSIT
ncbi:MerR family transcriptional regulator [Nocardia yunnanensis]|uniref:MerR family transcriptional regulator n=1 Tax=Nocardia yunnanensis TaxID=2382165 RepID=A0A386ZDW7_9NOCA|nr:MerR family transcriptional regulator [Nocardia yunnanensis]